MSHKGSKFLAIILVLVFLNPLFLHFEMGIANEQLKDRFFLVFVEEDAQYIKVRYSAEEGWESGNFPTNNDPPVYGVGAMADTDASY